MSIENETRKIYRKKQKEVGFKENDMVKVVRKSYPHEYGWPMYWVNKMDNMVGKVSTIMSIQSDGITLKDNFDYPYFVLQKIQKKCYKNYVKEQDKAGFKVGNYIKVISAAVSYERGWENSWQEPMDKMVGKTSRIRSIQSNGIVLDDGFDYPYFVLHKITYHTGQIFKSRFTGREFILATVYDNTVCLINLNTGGKFSTLIEVKDIGHITQEEFGKGVELIAE